MSIPGREGRLRAARIAPKAKSIRHMRRIALGPRPEPVPARFPAPPASSNPPWLVTIATKEHPPC